MLLRICIGFLSIALLYECTFAQDSEKTEFDSMCESWSSVNSEMTEKYAALNNGDASPGLADDYKDLVDEANKLIDAMRITGQEQLKSSPGDGKVIRALLGIMVHDAQNGRDQVVLEVGQSLINAKINPKYFEKAAKIDRLDPSQRHLFEELAVRHAEAIANDLPRVKMETSAGEIVLELFENEAPNTVKNFVSLVESGYYADKLFHRVIEDFVAQGGGFDIEGAGRDGPGYQIECECRLPDSRRNFPGTLSMAHAGRDTGGSQFFINFSYNKGLDRKHTVFGRVISGFDTLEKIERTAVTVNGVERSIEQAKPDKILSTTILRKRDHSYRVRKKGESALSEEEQTSKVEKDAELLDLKMDDSGTGDAGDKSEPVLEPAKEEQQSDGKQQENEGDQDKRNESSDAKPESSKEKESDKLDSRRP